LGGAPCEWRVGAFVFIATARGLPPGAARPLLPELAADTVQSRERTSWSPRMVQAGMFNA